MSVLLQAFWCTRKSPECNDDAPERVGLTFKFDENEFALSNCAFVVRHTAAGRSQLVRDYPDGDSGEVASPLHCASADSALMRYRKKDYFFLE